MEILVKLGKTKNSNEVKVTAPSPDCLVADLLAKVRRNLPPIFERTLQLSERSGSVVFLAMDANGPERLNETKRLSDYVPIGDSCTLWLMCAHVDDDGDVQ